MALRQDAMHFVLWPKEGMHFGNFCIKQGQAFKPSAAHLYPNIGQVPNMVEQSRDNLFTDSDKASSTKVRTGYRTRLLP